GRAAAPVGQGIAGLVSGGATVLRGAGTVAQGVGGVGNGVCTVQADLAKADAAEHRGAGATLRSQADELLDALRAVGRAVERPPAGGARRGRSSARRWRRASPRSRRAR